MSLGMKVRERVKIRTLDPGSRPESQRVASCANRLVVTSGAYREDDEVGHAGMTVRWIMPGRRKEQVVQIADDDDAGSAGKTSGGSQ